MHENLKNQQIENPKPKLREHCANAAIAFQYIWRQNYFRDSQLENESYEFLFNLA